jgi:hypothetical protein
MEFPLRNALLTWLGCFSGALQYQDEGYSQRERDVSHEYKITIRALRKSLMISELIMFNC